MIDQRIFKQFPLVGQQCASLSAGNDLEIIKAERAGIADGSKPLTAKAAAVRLAGIFQNQQIMLPGDLHDRLHIAGETLNMYRDDGLCMLGDFLFDVFR